MLGDAKLINKFDEQNKNIEKFSWTDIFQLQNAKIVPLKQCNWLLSCAIKKSTTGWWTSTVIRWLSFQAYTKLDKLQRYLI